MTKRRISLPAALILSSALAACAGTLQAPMAAFEPSGDPLADAAALLAAADSAGNAEQRAPFVDRLNAMNVALADGAQDDPLSAWRAEHQATGTPPWRGRALGPAYRRTRVPAGEIVRIEQIFYAGQNAEIAAQASGGGTVALAISNPRAEAVCAKSVTPRANCNWLPLFTERFSIELENSGSEAASVYLVFR